MDSKKQTLKALEWQTVLEDLANQSTCETGKLRCLETPVYSDENIIKYELKLTTEAKSLLDKVLYPPLDVICNVYSKLSLSVAGQILDSKELIDIAKTLSTSRKLKSFLKKHADEVPELYKVSENLFESRELEDNILDIFDDTGSMLDSASQELKSLRQRLRDQVDNLKNRLNAFINSSSVAKYLQDAVYTIRQDRYVVPVRAEHKSHVHGIVHDVSSSGATFFIEPKPIVELNNLVRETELKIDAEIRRILSELSTQVSECADELKYMLDNLTEFDFIFAKAKYSISIHGVEPEINSKKFISLKGVKHPTLLKVVEKVIPNDIEIGENFQVMIITGPNTGGKTVILKTLGLCTLMAKAGLHIPAYEGSIYPFENIFADIGDEQSLIQSLSTFSSHMQNIIEILNNTNDNTLILLDELGAGTDPLEGTALAEAILENINKKNARAIITTHFSELKALAYEKKGFYNASVEFDTENLQPTYKLLMGIPGKSNAIYIARNLGLESSVIEDAQNLYLNKKDPTGKILESLQDTQQQLSKSAKIAKEKEVELEELEKTYTEELEKIKTEKKKIINVYRKKFDGELLRAKHEIKDILDNVRRAKSEKIAHKSLTKLGKTASDLRQVSSEESQKLQPKLDTIDWDNVKIGDSVYITSLEQDGVLLSFPDKSNNVQVEVGLLKTKVKKDELTKTKTQKKKVKKQEPVVKQSYAFRKADVKNTLDLRGMLGEDGVSKLEYYLDEASLANLTPVYIVHGHGTGALRKAVRAYLAKSPYVKKYRKGHQEEGGDGVTVVDLK